MHKFDIYNAKRHFMSNVLLVCVCVWVCECQTNEKRRLIKWNRKKWRKLWEIFVVHWILLWIHTEEHFGTTREICNQSEWMMVCTRNSYSITLSHAIVFNFWLCSIWPNVERFIWFEELNRFENEIIFTNLFPQSRRMICGRRTSNCIEWSRHIWLDERPKARFPIWNLCCRNTNRISSMCWEIR